MLRFLVCYSDIAARLMLQEENETRDIQVRRQRRLRFALGHIDSFEERSRKHLERGAGTQELSKNGSQPKPALHKRR